MVEILRSHNAAPYPRSGANDATIASAPQISGLSLREILVAVANRDRHLDILDSPVRGRALANIAATGPRKLRAAPVPTLNRPDTAFWLRREQPAQFTATASSTPMKPRFCSPSPMPGRYDLNNRTGFPALASSKRLATRLIISPLWYSLGPNTLKNLSLAHLRRQSLAAGRALDHSEIEQVLAPTVQVHRFEALERRRREFVREAPAAAVAVGGGR